MNFSNLPVLLPSDSEPILPASRSVPLHRLDSSYYNVKSQATSHFSSKNNLNSNNGMVLFCLACITYEIQLLHKDQ